MYEQVNKIHQRVSSLLERYSIQSYKKNKLKYLLLLLSPTIPCIKGEETKARLDTKKPCSREGKKTISGGLEMIYAGILAGVSWNQCV